MNPVKDCFLAPCNINAQLCFLITDCVCRFQPSGNLRILLPFCQHSHGKLCGADAREVPPRKRLPCVVAQVLINRELALLFCDICVILICMHILLPAVYVNHYLHAVVKKMYGRMTAAVLMLVLFCLCIHPHIMLRIKRLHQRM